MQIAAHAVCVPSLRQRIYIQGTYTQKFHCAFFARLDPQLCAHQVECALVSNACLEMGSRNLKQFGTVFSEGLERIGATTNKATHTIDKSHLEGPAFRKTFSWFARPDQQSSSNTSAYCVSPNQQARTSKDGDKKTIG